ncbi:hypothetical protein AW111_19580 [Escherichia coli]|uniref:Uncharacterized protein n=2 Tax=Escherichia coli TaxID=562 RepID=A0A152UZW3_ECOLX|nr:hypothetical protein Z0896 [Escherichia coli O157:H7 str. EDL933]ACT70648.1 predicted protein [Escherichia coli O157:H7 str. TW14359]ADD55507.1 hypothetical protein G2583_0896 [Escherichia coli O55:H7 str. CB9615]AIF92362.1 hypothetical protein SS17_0768 [Escherichia coli O157:H7 str. SS17]ALH89481.1 hypothetical protein AO055_03950 [Escherichia coli O157:H7]AMW44962.1 hypothetical protein ARC77_23295 [Escherichia coli]ASE46477.1 hypothetical protein CEP72_04685 [Escherichia coli O157]EFO
MNCSEIRLKSYEMHLLMAKTTSQKCKLEVDHNYLNTLNQVNFKNLTLMTLVDITH